MIMTLESESVHGLSCICVCVYMFEYECENEYEYMMIFKGDLKGQNTLIFQLLGLLQIILDCLQNN